MKKKCYHTVIIDIDDWEAADKVDNYNPKSKYVKCVKCKKIMEEESKS